MSVQEESKPASASDRNQAVPEADSERVNGQSIQLASKQYEDIIQFQEPSTSKNMTVKAEIRINILREPDNLADDSHSQISLSLMKEERKSEEESYHTMDTCVKDKNVNTNIMTHLTERIRALRGEIPPPYEPSHPPPAYSSIQRSGQTTEPVRVYQTTQPAYNASRTPAYRRSGREPYPYDDYDDPFVSSSEQFQERTIRNKFIQKVYAILSIQLMFSFGFVLLCIFHKPTGDFVRIRFETLIILSVLWFILYIAIMCYKACRRIFPLNLILLVLFTICEAYMLAATSVWYRTQIVMMTLGATAALCLLVSFIAWQNWFDITQWGFILAIAGLAVMLFGFVAMIVTIITHSRIVYLIYAGLATGLFTLYLLYDTQCILGGRRVELSPEEYIMGVMTLYVDICLIFMYMLQLFNTYR